MPNTYIVIFLLVVSSSIRAQSSQPILGKSEDVILYQFPNDGDTYVSEKTTLIIRPNPSFVHGSSERDFSFDVRGASSGPHSGKVVIADDDETVIFKPDQPFAVNERVDVIFSILSTENISPIPFHFRINALSEAEQGKLLKAFGESEEKENLKYVSGHIQANSNDTITPSQFIVDTLVPEKIAPGDIFTTKNGTDAFLETLDNHASPIYQQQVFNPPCEDFRPWENKFYSYIYSNQVFLLDSDHHPVDTIACGYGYVTDDHEFRLLPNGHVLLMANEARDTDMRVITGDSTATSHGTVIGGIIQELDNAKPRNVVFFWRTWDHFQDTDVVHIDFHSPNLRTLDYCHLNSLEEDTDGNIIASFRNMDEVTKINRTTGKIVWRWGGKNNYFHFGSGDTIPFSYQHDVRRIANGHITMMDNGNYHPTTWGDGSVHDTAWSRAIEYELDESSLTATAVWEYRNIDFTSAAGNVQRLPNGNTFICSGDLGLEKATEVTSEGEKVFQLSFPIGAFTFRMYRFPVPPSSSNLVRLTGAAATARLQSIYPNPAQNRTTVTFSVVNAGDAEIDLLDVLGNTVLRAHEKLSGAGAYSDDLDLHELAAGIYYCKISADGNTMMNKVIVRK